MSQNFSMLKNDELLSIIDVKLREYRANKKTRTLLYLFKLGFNGGTLALPNQTSRLRA